MKRRHFLGALSATATLAACSDGAEEVPISSEPAGAGRQRLGRKNLCFITDEYSQDLDAALGFAKEFGITQVEIRSVGGKYCFLHDAETLREIQAKLKAAGVRVALLATPILKCVAPGFDVSPEVEKDIKAAAKGFPIPGDLQFGRSMEFLHMAIEAAKIFETNKIRVFSFWRTVSPQETHPLLLEKLDEVAAVAEKEGMTLCIENENACNLATCAEMMQVIRKAPENVGILWDPLNGEWAGEPAFPDGYGLLDKARIEHMHLKDYVTGEATGERKIVGVGEGELPYSDIFLALDEDGYDGALSMETHHRIAGSKEAASRVSMQGIVKALRVIR